MHSGIPHHQRAHALTLVTFKCCGFLHVTSGQYDLSQHRAPSLMLGLADPIVSRTPPPPPPSLSLLYLKYDYFFHYYYTIF